jgi:hypothetical protein
VPVLEAGVGSALFLQHRSEQILVKMENFITGYTGHEHQLRAALLDVLGEEKYEYFFDKVSSLAAFGTSTKIEMMIFSVPRILLHRTRCQILCIAGTQLHSSTCTVSNRW